ncbi:tail protein X [Yersinia enterocolitica]|uniref:tail protein X n=1 Tax=Yersinia enterocolitica TaxID=630 RepID=UPI00155AAD00|nr:tail protein X [Yersinia enterocolitica]MBX9485845.1 tail protein X [Yersinia enterocolitica]NQS96694.1 tail protein X [Yersinia enterocolitica]NQT43371.1 tail protein X [Yersinia enterocolitica]NQT98829.1 tail protein X [Yersinia enterocolitica]HDL8115211.1 tail protein X [Yersinia enterocolitica]
MASIYTTTQGDAWDQISFKVYGDEFHTHYLIDANTAHRYVCLFSGGIELNIPVAEPKSAAEDRLPPWKRGK